MRKQHYQPDSNLYEPVGGVGVAYKQGDAPSGGMGVVAKGTGVDTLLGGAPKGVTNQEWQALLNNNDGQPPLPNLAIYKGQEMENGQTSEYNIVQFTMPEELRKAHYKFVNEVIWPLAHSMDINPELSHEELRDLYDAYQQYNDLQNMAMQNFIDGKVTYNGQLLNEEEFNKTFPGIRDGEDLPQFWTHDYQSMSVPGQVFSWHIPFPELEYLLDTKLPLQQKGYNGETEVSLIDTPFIKDYFETLGSSTLRSFQRPQDVANLIMLMAYLQEMEQDTPSFAEANNMQEFWAGLDIKNRDDWPEMRQRLEQAITVGQGIPINFLGQQTTLVSVPVGVDVDACEKTGQRWASETQQFATEYKNKDHFFNTIITEVKDENDKVIEEKFMDENFTGLDPQKFQDRNPTLNDVVEEIKGRNWIMAIHRNDYTKGSEEILMAAEGFFDTADKVRENTFFLSLQPTRSGMSGYAEYAQRVFEHASKLKKNLQEKFPELSKEEIDKAVVIMPLGMQRDDIMRLFRRDEAKVYLSPSFKDGYSLMPTEFLAANSGLDVAKGVVTGTGAGNSEVLWNGEYGDAHQGAYTVSYPKTTKEYKDNFEYYAQQAAEQILYGINEILDPAKEEKVKRDFHYMQDRIHTFNAKYFSDVVQDNYPAAAVHSGAWKEQNGRYEFAKNSTDQLRPLHAEMAKGEERSDDAPNYMTEALQRKPKTLMDRIQKDPIKEIQKKDGIRKTFDSSPGGIGL